MSQDGYARFTMETPRDELDQLLDTAARWQTAGHRLAIATVVETWGSAPRRIGSHMLVRDDGAFEGSVSGGCVEGDIIVQATEAIATGETRRLEYGVTQGQAWEVGLPCGGNIAILVQPVSEAGFPPERFAAIAASRAAGERLSITTELSTGPFVRHYDPPLRLAIIGAVHIAQALVPMAAMLGYRTLLIDPRAAYATPERFPGTILDTGWPDEALAAWKPDAGSAVITLAHDPKLDDPALSLALASPAFYIGALGSTRSHAKRIERLAAAGLAPEALARIHGPVGLPIGAATPAEIALSIMAGITAAWRKR